MRKALPSTTSGHGPPFFTIAGIQESVANQKTNPFTNQRRTTVLVSPLRESHNSGASAKRQSVISPIGGYDAQSRNPGRSQNTTFAFLRSCLIMTPPS